ncbi:ABC transporter substrate-binding protein [Rufibacter sp. DG15C]|uniref:ABC transporter substrate-binding protein n=1 Tax=Rufibacter sp. DG15C TaxID=1379909 RepID=UPI0009EAA419|nr:helical backbone metal receptor [Rufibacter sp. DG15C]
MGHQVLVPQAPQRIVSLVPSQTELLFDLGLGDRVVGVTKFCLHPKELVKGKTKIGGTKNFKTEVIDQLQPDLIIGNKEENYQEGIEALQQKYPVWMSDIYTLEDAFAMMEQVGKITRTEPQAGKLTSIIKTQFEKIEPIQPPVTAAYFIWKNPYMAVGGNNFIDDILTRCGLVNALQHLPRYPEVTPAMLAALNPQVILLSSEPFPFQEKHIQEFKEICPQAKVLIVDGEMFSWYGSRLQYAVPYLQKVLEEIRSV